MIDIILSAVIILILSSAAIYIKKEKRNGAKCIGCSQSKSCKTASKCK